MFPKKHTAIGGAGFFMLKPKKMTWMIWGYPHDLRNLQIHLPGIPNEKKENCEKDLAHQMSNPLTTLNHPQLSPTTMVKVVPKTQNIHRDRGIEWIKIQNYTSSPPKGLKKRHMVINPMNFAWDPMPNTKKNILWSQISSNPLLNHIVWRVLDMGAKDFVYPIKSGCVYSLSRLDSIKSQFAGENY